MVLVFIDLLFKKSGCWDVKRLGLAGYGGPVPLGREARTVGFSVFQFFGCLDLCEGPQRPMCGGFCDGLEND